MEQLCQTFAEFGTVTSPIDTALSNTSWGNISSSDELTSQEGYFTTDNDTLSS